MDTIIELADSALIPVLISAGFIFLVMGLFPRWYEKRIREALIAIESRKQNVYFLAVGVSLLAVAGLLKVLHVAEENRARFQREVLTPRFVSVHASDGCWEPCEGDAATCKHLARYKLNWIFRDLDGNTRFINREIVSSNATTWAEASEVISLVDDKGNVLDGDVQRAGATLPDWQTCEQNVESDPLQTTVRYRLRDTSDFDSDVCQLRSSCIAREGSLRLELMGCGDIPDGAVHLPDFKTSPRCSDVVPQPAPAVDFIED
jgi:hypothetical protein